MPRIHKHLDRSICNTISGVVKHDDITDIIIRIECEMNVLCQTIIWSDVDILSTGHKWRYFNDISIEIPNFSLKSAF